MGFKSRVMPALEVLRADGVACRGFVAKPAVPLAVPAAAASARPSLSGSRR